VDRLKDAGFLNTDTSLLFADRTDARDAARFSGGTPAHAGAGIGTILSGAMGWLTRVDAPAIPGVGPVVAAGPISTVLSDVIAGGGVGAISRALIDMGIPEYEARRYEAKIKQSGILVSVRTMGAEEAQLAEEIFKEEDAQDIACSSEIIASQKAAGSRQVMARSTSSTSPQPARAASGGSIQ